MADKKRKTLQIKRPDANSAKSKKKALPKVKMDEKTATSAVDTDELTGMGPKTAKLKKPEGTNLGSKGKTTRIALPDEDKIRRARRANATQDLDAEDALPSAEQIARAQKNATMPIMIDTESVEEGYTSKLTDKDDNLEAMDRTMEIDADALSTKNIADDLEQADSTKGDGDQTMKIDPEALKTANLEKDLQKAANDTSDNDKDQTMQIDPDALATGNLEDLLNEDASSVDKDQTMEIDPTALDTGTPDPSGQDKIMSMETMQMETMQMDSIADEILEAESDDSPTASQESDLTVAEMQDSFNAQTMEMDASMLADELAKKNTGEIAPAKSEEDRSQTMDLSNNRPKTIMIKRPSKKAPSSSSTPTVKAVRPDAATIRTARPVTASTSEPKQDTSRIDVPGESGSVAKEGKTIKLRRPSGAPANRSRDHISRVAENAGLSMNDDGSVTATINNEPEMGAAWLAVAVLTLLVSVGAIYSLYAHTNSELPMPGRLVDMNQELIQAL